MEVTFSPIENKILQLVVRNAFPAGMELLKDSFGPAKPPAFDFIQRIFTELNRQGRNREAWDFMTQVAVWVQRHPEVQRMLETARRIYYDSLLVEGNNVMEAARQKLQVFAESLEGMDALHRDRIEKENRQTLEDLYREALRIYQLAHEVSPRALGALTGMFRCHKELRNQAEAAELSRLIEEVYAEEPADAKAKKDAEGEEEETPSPTPELLEIRSVPADLEVEMRRIQEMFDRGEKDETIAALDLLLLGNPQFIPGLLLKARVLASRREFKPAQRLIDEATRIDARDKRVQEARIEFLEHKFKLLVAGASEFLDQGLRLGTLLGRSFFERALVCINQGLEICPDDLTLLDQRYTCLVYLERMEEAREARKDLYIAAPQYVASFERENRSALCFLAGFAYEGRPGALEAFRTLRREWLVPFPAGRTFIAWYCRHAPGWVALARARRWPPSLFRALLAPLHLLGSCLNRHLRSRHSRQTPWA